MQVAIPEFDGRLITVPFSFKEQGPDEVPVYVADPERAARVAGIAVRHARLKHKPNADKKLALVFTAYPTKHSRVGNAVGLDTPASAVRVLDALRDAGYVVGGHPDNGDELIHRLINAGGHDVEWLTEEQLAAAPARVPLADYRAWFDKLDPDLKRGMLDAWGEPPGSLYVDGDDIVLASLQFGNVVVMIQPPRGFGENPIAIYHDPDMPPSHHYMAAYRWLEAATSEGASARTPSCTWASTARWSGCRARASGSAVAARRTPSSVNSRSSTPSSSTTPARAPRPSGAATPRSSTTSCRRWPAPTPTATWPSWSSSSTSTRWCPTWTRRRLRRSARRSGRWSRRPNSTTTCMWRTSRTTRRSTSSSCTSTAICARSRTCRSATVCTSSAAARRPSRASTSCWPCCAPPRCGAAPRTRCRGCGPASPSTSAWSRRSCSPSRARR